MLSRDEASTQLTVLKSEMYQPYHNQHSHARFRRGFAPMNHDQAPRTPEQGRRGAHHWPLPRPLSSLDWIIPPERSGGEEGLELLLDLTLAF